MANYIVTGVIALVVGAAVGFLFDRMRRGAAYQRRDDILSQATKEAENIRKTHELEAKEELLQRRESLEKELNSTRDELREQERRLDKRESGLDEQHEDIRKKERMLELTQQKLTDRGKEIDARECNTEKVLKQEQEQLFKISGMDREAAKNMLLERLERDLSNETGAVILKHQSRMKEECERLAREIVGMAVQR